MKTRREYDLKIIGRNLRRLRQSKGYTVTDIMHYLRYASEQAIYKYERGAGYPYADTLLALMDLYGASVDDLVDIHSDDGER